MAINMMCMNSECKYYWEDCCQRNFEETRIVIDENGKCETFEPGICDYYKEGSVTEKQQPNDNYAVDGLTVVDNKKEQPWKDAMISKFNRTK